MLDQGDILYKHDIAPDRAVGCLESAETRVVRTYIRTFVLDEYWKYILVLIKWRMAVAITW